VNYSYDNDTLYGTNADFSNFFIIEAVIYVSEYDSVKDFLSFLKANAMFLSILSIFIFVPFKLHLSKYKMYIR